MSSAICHKCHRQIKIHSGYHQLPCLLPIVNQAYQPDNEDGLTLICDIRCPSCQSLIGHQIIAGTRDLIGLWKLNDDLYDIKETTLSQLINIEVLNFVKEYEIYTKRISKSQAYLAEIFKGLQQYKRHPINKKHTSK